MTDSIHYCPTFHRFYWMLAVLLCFAINALAQSQPCLDLPKPTLKVDVDLVTLNFSVLEKGRRGIGNLRKGDITIYEDEISQEIAFFDSHPAPLSLVVLLDFSESMAPFSKQLEAASRILPALLNEQDQTAVIAFSNFPEVLQEFTYDRERVRAALKSACRGFFGATNINDAVYLAARKIAAEASGERKAILLLSDGQGNRGERERAFEVLRSCGATLLGVGLGFTSRFFREPVLLNRWAKETGGDFVPYSSESQLRHSLQDVLDSARSRYSAAYVPKNRRHDGAFRRLKVEISRDSSLVSHRVTIQSPEGYYAPSDDSDRR
jgi:Ca-activated chloride channel family protein